MFSATKLLGVDMARRNSEQARKSL